MYFSPFKQSTKLKEKQNMLLNNLVLSERKMNISFVRLGILHGLDWSLRNATVVRERVRKRDAMMS